MSERSDGRTREVEVDSGRRSTDTMPDFDSGPGLDRDPEEAAERSRASSRVRGRLRSSASSLFSVRVFLLVLALSIVSMVFAGTVLPIGGVAGLAGIALVGFVLGAGRDGSRYLELLLAGGLASAVGSFLDYLVLSALGAGLPLVALGAGTGAIAGVVGHYFGRDLRDGLTKSV